eukprot:scaffold17572_cov32-Tisochrysis_lutea.AAC.10
MEKTTRPARNDVEQLISGTSQASRVKKCAPSAYELGDSLKPCGEDDGVVNRCEWQGWARTQYQANRRSATQQLPTRPGRPAYRSAA